MNRQFRLVTVRPPGGAARRLVLEEGSDVRRCLTSESASSEATVTGWRPDSATKAPLFQITGRGVPGEPIGNLYQMAAVGCCGSQDLFTYFSLLTGRPLFSSSLAVVTFERAEPGATRFAGVHDTFSAGSPPEVEADSSVIAVIGWSDEEGPLQRIAVHADRPEPFAAAAIGLRHPGVRAAARTLKVIPKDSAAKVELQVDLVAPGDDRRVAIRIPIDGLVLHPEAATLSPGIRLRPLP
jgi:hypothetical protein